MHEQTPSPAHSSLLSEPMQFMRLPDEMSRDAFARVACCISTQRKGSPRHHRYFRAALKLRSERRTTSRAIRFPSSSPASVEYRKCQPRRTRESAHSNAAARAHHIDSCVGSDLSRFLAKRERWCLGFNGRKFGPKFRLHQPNIWMLNRGVRYPQGISELERSNLPRALEAANRLDEADRLCNHCDRRW
jgi:hypothetical protein